MAPEETQKSAAMSMRTARTRFRRHMRVVKEISDDLWALLHALPTPDKEELDEAVSPIGGITPEMHFLGALNEVHFLISEAVLIADEEKRFARSRAESFIVDPRIIKQLENEARLRHHRPPPPADEDETEEDAE
jgi:hypothetical protein